MRSREFEKPMSGVHYMNARPALCLSDLNQFLNRLSCTVVEWVRALRCAT